MSFIDNIDANDIKDNDISEIDTRSYYTFIIKGSGLSADKCTSGSGVAIYNIARDCIKIKIVDEEYRVLRQNLTYLLRIILPKDINIYFIAFYDNHGIYYAFTLRCNQYNSNCNYFTILESLFYNFRFRQFLLIEEKKPWGGWEPDGLYKLLYEPLFQRWHFQSFPTVQSIADLFFFQSEVSEINKWKEEPQNMKINAKKAKLIYLTESGIEYPNFDKLTFCDFVKNSKKHLNWKCRAAIPQGKVFDIYFAVDIKNIEAMALCVPR